MAAPAVRRQHDRPAGTQRNGYCTVKFKYAVCVIGPLVALIATLKRPVEVPVTTAKFTGLEGPPPGLGLVTITGY